MPLIFCLLMVYFLTSRQKIFIFNSLTREAVIYLWVFIHTSFSYMRASFLSLVSLSVVASGTPTFLQITRRSAKLCLIDVHMQHVQNMPTYFTDVQVLGLFLTVQIVISLHILFEWLSHKHHTVQWCTSLQLKLHCSPAVMRTLLWLSSHQRCGYVKCCLGQMSSF